MRPETHPKAQTLRENLPAGTVAAAIKTPHGEVPGVWHFAAASDSAVVMAGDTCGGVRGPAGAWEPLAAQLQRAGVTALRLDYRKPGYYPECLYDVMVGVEALRQRGVGRVALVGWGFGGPVVITAGAASGLAAGVAVIACETYGSQNVSHLAQKHLLLIHGTSDHVVPDTYSQALYLTAPGPKELVLYPGDDHAIAAHASEMVHKLRGWAVGLLKP